MLDELQSKPEIFGVGGLADGESRVGTPGPRPIDKPGPGGMQGGFGPFRSGALGANGSGVEVVQHAAVAQDDECLIEPVVVTLGSSQDLATPVAHGRHDLLT